MRKKNIIYSIIAVVSCAIILVSSAVMALSATSQIVKPSLSVTFNGENVHYTVQGWYQVKNNASHPYLVNSSGTEGVSFSATEISQVKTLKISNVPADNNITLTSINTFALFTFKFSNTASSGAFGMKVSLTGSTPEDSNISVKYLVSNADASDYFSSIDSDANKISALTTKASAVTSENEFSNVFIEAGHYKYFYVLVSVIDLTLNATYSNNLSWNVTCADTKTEPVSYTVTINIGSMDNCEYCFAFEIWDDWTWNGGDDINRAGNKVADFTSQIKSGNKSNLVATATTNKIILWIEGCNLYSGNYTYGGGLSYEASKGGNVEEYLIFLFTVTNPTSPYITIEEINFDH